MASADPSASERAYQQLRGHILDHTYAPGTMLGEAALAVELGMSRTPVRVALARLQDEGWIVVYPKRGALVQGVTDRTAAELADARFVLETTAIDRATPARRRELAGPLADSVEAQRAAFEAGDLRQFIDLTLRFHRSFIEAGSNAVMLELYDRLSDRHRFVLFGSGDRLLKRCADIIAEHQRLVDRLRAGDARGFTETLRAHIAETNATPIRLFGSDSGKSS
ncbi:GntR family transcriptional regulator [Cumulibacter manganitolerans]|uniref:GntR family transcriptional regulator n=1 Tax=Cumulibacter manganitolerans TaxID=1884992 RepID=UPI001296FC7E|nr:GntR family transcriptional regulator [Cumulibacter manganitolerans]